ncbi:hypothetical protein [Blastopirellula marina]|uniref:Zinc finger/thioredoxin putative domain-containing protein n=1 Tax=Blastopirellula marina TaxID=124 RepID=A0A2S8GT30_9BACT|nr:hypothetical protein [Blastopirellula marina]PQO47531.1 hypothetical protein C5Y93_02405 [Blastopirellula marina]
MAIEFSCGSCSAKFRIPDTMAGKKIRCPKCQAVQQVPGGEPEPEIEYGFKNEGKAGDDFWSQIPDSSQMPAANPYDSPAPAAARPQRRGLSPADARSRVAIPATALYVLSLGGFFLSIICAFFFALRWIFELDNVPTQQRIATLIVGLIGLSLNYVTIQGANNMRALREPGSVWLTLILALLPCGSSCLCPVAIPFAIWGIVLMCDRRISGHFRG